MADTITKLWGSLSTGNTKFVQNGDAVTVDGTLNYAADAGANDTYVITIGGISAYTTGMLVIFKANTASTGACTLNINSLGAKALKSKGGSSDPENNYILANSMVMCVYDGTNFQIINPDMEP